MGTACSCAKGPSCVLRRASPSCEDASTLEPPHEAEPALSLARPSLASAPPKSNMLKANIPLPPKGPERAVQGPIDVVSIVVPYHTTWRSIGSARRDVGRPPCLNHGSCSRCASSARLAVGDPFSSLTSAQASCPNCGPHGVEGSSHHAHQQPRSPSTASNPGFVRAMWTTSSSSTQFPGGVAYCAFASGEDNGSRSSLRVPASRSVNASIESGGLYAEP